MSFWVWAVVAAACAKVATGAIAFAAGTMGTLPGGDLPAWFTIAMVLGYGSVAVGLLAGGRADPRARTLGVFLLLVASTFSDTLAHYGRPLGAWGAFMNSLRVDALMPFFFCLFAREFPTAAPPGRVRTLSAHLAQASLGAGLLLWAANAALDFGFVEPGSPAQGLLGVVWRNSRLGFYWPAVFILMLPVAPVLIERARHTGPKDRRRVTVFVSGLLVGFLPITTDIVLRATSPWWAALMSGPVENWTVIPIVVATLLSVPFTMAYSVLVDRVVDVQLLVRAALQYAFARYSILTLVSLPFIGLAYFVYANRHATVQELFFGRLAAILLVGLGLGMAALRFRKPTLNVLDRRFFREQYDAQQILSGLVGAAREVDSTGRLAELLRTEIDRALHVEQAAVLVHDDVHSCFAAGDDSVRPLPEGSLLVRLLSGSDDPLDVDLETARSPMRRLSADEQRWLTDSRLRLLVPLRAAGGDLIGMLALGEKKSGVAYSGQDRRLLAAVGASGGICLDRWRARNTPASGAEDAGSAGDGAPPALECGSCGLVHPRGREACHCGSSLSEAMVPAVLAGKFRVERRLGAGGMGVVYRAEDLTLRRTVAVKTLPRVSPGLAARLRQEARAMALVTHPNLELIYGAESWRGRPVLVVEYLAGGTLKDRLARGPLGLPEVLSLGSVLADALHALHRRSLLHRDIKPSNIGYAAGGVVKLLDFGLVKLLRSDEDTTCSGALSDTTGPAGLRPSMSHSLAGTPPYMAPEAIRCEQPGPSFDLWSLAVVLFEALTGVRPFHGSTLAEMLAHIQSAAPPDPRALLPVCAPEVSDFFAKVLAPERRDRPGTSRQFAERLAELRQRALAS